MVISTRVCFANNGNSTRSVFFFCSSFSNALMSEGIPQEIKPFHSSVSKNENCQQQSKNGVKNYEVKKEQNDEQDRRAIFGHSIIPPRGVV